MRFFTIIIILLTACSQEQEPQQNKGNPQSSQSSAPQQYLCQGCHQLEHDSNHDFACVKCHQGKSPAPSRTAAHDGLIEKPAHPRYLAASCGECHPIQTKDIRHAGHFTLKNKINLVRRAFGADHDLQSLAEITGKQPPATPLNLVDDLLRRRCLRCHLYYEGDPYPATSHGTGCGACHLKFTAGSLENHKFLASPGDDQCLSCHYGNHVGNDYYGRHDRDLHWDYRTPHTRDGGSNRPWGIESHQLTPDIHQQAGMICLDCHHGQELMKKESTITCRSCHQTTDISQEDTINIKNGKTLTIPALRHKAHDLSNRVACQVCHGQWSFNDQGIHLLRLDEEDFDAWAALSAQESFEAEYQIDNSLYGEEDYPHPWMTDKISGKAEKGLWLKSYQLRRWEEPVICRDQQGIIQVCRPILDLHLSYVNENEEVIFDNIPGQQPENGLLPYTPHTTGKAGPFYRQRLGKFDLKINHGDQL